MQVIQSPVPLNPDTALQTALFMLVIDHNKTESRNGPCLRFKTPVTTVWSDPTQRISWSPLRDANPFLHYIESFWMLSGANDVKTVGTLAKNMFNYSDDGETLYGAYGYRWRRHFGFDQITAIIEELKANPTTRRCVLQMWDGHEELTKATTGCKDVCCNHAIAFDPCDGYLNMTVSNRSNDMVWGAFGANVVHMSILHEYVAKQSGLKLGTYYQMSNNLHLYLDLSPVMSKIATYEDGVLTPNSVLAGTEGLPSDRQEALFTDFNLNDHDFTQRLGMIFNLFNSGIKVVPDEHEPHAVQVLLAMMHVFLTYKEQGARVAVKVAHHLGVESYWIDNAVAWLVRRPSYAN